MYSYRSFSFARRLVLAACLLLVARPGLAQTVDSIEATPALHEVFADHFTIGALLSYPHVGLPNDPVVPGQSAVVSPTGGYLIRHHMNFMAPGNNMKPQNTVDIAASALAWQNAATQAERDSINVHPVVRFIPNMIAQLNWARRQGFTFRAHTMVWHNQTPGTAFFREGYSATGARLSPERMTERMSNYIASVIRLLHEGWPGMVTAMDVVNEAVLDNGQDRAANNEWYTTYGDMSYVARAFEAARRHSVAYGETQIKLYYNDYNTHLPAKADGIVRVMKPIFEAGYLDGIGMQQHDQWNSPTAAQWLASYNKFDAISHEMAVTELDVNPQQTQPSAQRLREQANQYAMFFKLFMDHSAGSGRGKIVNVTKDGLNDQYAFVANASLWDAANRAKPAFYAVAKVGFAYEALDTLLAYAAGLDESAYSESSWAVFAGAHDAARAAMERQYSYQTSAADALETAHLALLEAIAQLQPGQGTDAETDAELPASPALHQNYPNPFNPHTTIRFELPAGADVRLDVFDVLGRRVATLVDARVAAGRHEVSFDASGLPSGVYVYQLRTGAATLSKAMQVLQ